MNNYCVCSFPNHPQSHTYWMKFGYSLFQLDTRALLISELIILHLCIVLMISTAAT